MSEDLKCRICGAPATIHLSRVINGKVHKIHLCEKCAAKHKAAEFPLIKFAEMITKKLFGEKLGKEILEGTVKSFSEKDLKVGKKCPNCGLSEREFEKSERMGCPQCYEVFSNELNAILPKIQHATALSSDAESTEFPKTKASSKPAEVSDVETLERRLGDAVAKEDYLQAAKIRDEIARLKQKPAKSKRPRKAIEKLPAKKASRRGEAGLPASKTTRKGKKQ